ncbi:MAG TPA: hypothetical protein VFJ87_09670 [Rhodanobacteraceae bacterium]|nr:hypothetical protein [Rhodanobacteraceae bacterium]
MTTRLRKDEEVLERWIVRIAHNARRQLALAVRLQRPDEFIVALLPPCTGFDFGGESDMDLKYPLNKNYLASESAMERIPGGSNAITRSRANPPWHYVLRSLEVAKAHVRQFDFKFNGESCYVVNRFALGAIMATRNAKGKLLHFELLPGDWPGSPYLALADHYMHMRAAMSQKRDGVTHAFANRAMFQYLRIGFYDLMKYEIIGYEYIEDKLGVSGPAHWLDYREREDKRFPLSAPGGVPREWAYRGMDDGSKDLKDNPDTPEDPAWFATELRKACNIEA